MKTRPCLWCFGVLVAATAASSSLAAPPAATNSQTNHPFAIYFAIEPVDRRLLIRGQGDWSMIKLSSTPIISDADILSYNFSQHAMRLTPTALAQIPRPPVRGIPFVVVANGQKIYVGVFVTGASSMSFAVPAIVVDRRLIVTNQPIDTLVIERAYPQASFSVGPDPRSDSRIKSALGSLHKLTL